MNEEKVKQNFEDMLDKFNFHKVKLTMKALDWTWAGTKEGIPTVSEMEENVTRLFESAMKQLAPLSSYIRISSGGFSVEIDKKTEHVIIQFIVEDQDSSDYE